MGPDSGDWDPLPPEGLEDLQELERRRREVRRQAAQEEGEQKLREMIAQSKVAAPPSALNQSLGKVVARQDRKEKAASSTVATEARHLTSFLQPEDVPLDAEYEEGRDPREDEPWFRKLPPSVQQQYRERWEWERKRFDPLAQQNLRRLKRTLWEGAGVFVAADFLVGMFSGWLLIHGLVMALTGAAAGLLWHFTRADRFGHAFWALPMYFLAQLVLLGTWNPFRLFFGALVLVHACAYRGLRVEHRKAEGTW